MFRMKSVNLQHSSYKDVSSILVENNANPDQMFCSEIISSVHVTYALLKIFKGTPGNFP